MQLYCIQYIFICQHLFLFFQKISIWCRLSGNILEIFSKSTSSGTFFHQISNNSAFRGTNMEICPKIGPSCCFFHQISKNGAFHGTNMEIVAKALPRIEEGALRDHRSRRDSYLLVLFFSRRNFSILMIHHFSAIRISSFTSAASSRMHSERPDGTSTPWHSGCSCLRRRTCLSSYPASCSR